MAERDLVIRTAVTGTAESKAQLDSLKQSVDGVGTENAELATGASAASAALREEGASAQTAAVGLGQAATSQRAVAQETRVVAIASENARVAVAALVTAMVNGGAGGEAAMKKAEVAVGLLAQKIQIAQAAGAPIPREAVDQLESYRRNISQASEAIVGHTAAGRQQVVVSQAVIAALGGTRAALAQVAATAATGGATFQASLTAARASVKALELAIKETQAAGGVVTPTQLLALETYKAQLASASVVTAGATSNARLYTAATAAAGQAIVGKTVSLGTLTAGFMRFLGPVGLAITAIALLPTAFKAARDAIDRMNGGMKDLEGGMSEFEKWAKKVGVSVKEGFSFVEAHAGMTFFLREYATNLKIGENATRNFVDGNKRSISLWMQAFEDAGEQIPLALLEIAGKYDILTPKQQELIDKMKESKKPVDDLAGSFRELGKEMSAEYTFDFVTGEQIADIRTGLQGVATDARDVAAALREIKPAADIAFPVISGGHSQLGPQTGVPPIT